MICFSIKTRYYIWSLKRLLQNNFFMRNHFKNIFFIYSQSCAFMFTMDQELIIKYFIRLIDKNSIRCEKSQNAHRWSKVQRKFEWRIKITTRGQMSRNVLNILIIILSKISPLDIIKCLFKIDKIFWWDFYINFQKYEIICWVELIVIWFVKLKSIWQCIIFSYMNWHFIWSWKQQWCKAKWITQVWNSD